MGDIFWVILVGFGMGFIGSIPPLGPVALMIINRVFKGQLKFAFFAGVGGALAEVIYSALAVTGVGLLRTKLGATPRLLGFVSAAILLVVGLYFFYQSHREHGDREHGESAPSEAGAERAAKAASPEEVEGSSLAHFARGFSIAIVNPILIVNWTLAVAYFFSLFHLKASLVGQLLFAVAVGVGKIIWTFIEVFLLNMFRQHYSKMILGRVERGLSVAVVLSALFLAYQATFQM